MPASLLRAYIYNWFNEAKKFTPDLRVLIHTGVNRSKKVDRFQHYHLVLTTYGIVRQDIKTLKEFPFHYVILDESQTVKNPESKTAMEVWHFHQAPGLCPTQFATDSDSYLQTIS